MSCLGNLEEDNRKGDKGKKISEGILADLVKKGKRLYRRSIVRIYDGNRAFAVCLDEAATLVRYCPTHGIHYDLYLKYTALVTQLSYTNESDPTRLLNNRDTSRP